MRRGAGVKVVWVWSLCCVSKQAMATARTSLETSKAALRLEAVEAIGREKRCTPDLSWLLSQSSTVSSGDDSVFELYSGDTTAVRFLDKQTYKQWKAHFDFQRMTHPWRMRQRTVVLQPINCKSLPSGYGSLSEIDSFFLQGLQKFCEGFFTNMHIRVAEPIDLSRMGRLTSRVHPDTNREQFLVGDILKYLKSHRPREARCVLGITLVDLYPDSDSNFVLGHASLTDGCAVASFGRHFNSCLAVDGPNGVSLQFLYLWVVIRVVTHELCHTFGMKHCYYFQCAMNKSSSIEQAAAQPLFLCPVCSRKLQKALNFNLTTWYTALSQRLRGAEEEMKTTVRDEEGSVACGRQDSDQSRHSSHPTVADLSHEDSRTCLLSRDGSSSCQGDDSSQTQTAFSSSLALYLQYLEQATGWIDRANLSLARHLRPSEQ